MRLFEKTIGSLVSHIQHAATVRHQASAHHCLRICEQLLAARDPRKANVPSHCMVKARQQGWQQRSRHAAPHVAASGEFGTWLRGIAGCGRLLPLLTAPRTGMTRQPVQEQPGADRSLPAAPCTVLPVSHLQIRARTRRHGLPPRAPRPAQKTCGGGRPSGCPPPRHLPVRHRHQMLLSPTMWISWPRPQY